MLQDDQPMASEVTLMAREHFNKLASLAVRVQGARELGVLAAHSSVGDSMIPTEFVIEKMAANWAARRAEFTSAVDGAEKLSAVDLEKLASNVLSGDVAWDDLTEMEKVAIGKLLGKATSFLTKGKTVKLPSAPKPPGGGVKGKLTEGWNVMTGKGRTVKGPTSAADSAMKEVQDLRRADPAGGAVKMPGGSTGPAKKPASGQGPYRTAEPPAPPPPGAAKPPAQPQATQNQSIVPAQTQKPAPAPPSAPGTQPTGPRKPLMSWKTKAMIGGTGAALGATYLGGKALDTATAFLTPQPPGTAYQYGGGAPSHFMNPQMGM